MLPTTVTLIEPDEATLAIVMLLGPGASSVSDAVRLFICQPVVITTRRSVQIPIAGFTVTAVSEFHVTLSQPVPPIPSRLL